MRRAVYLSLALGILTLVPLQASSVLYSNFTFSGTYPGGRGICGATSACGFYQAVAVSFDPSATGNVGSIELPLVWSGEGDGALTIDLANDATGAPGSVMESYSYDITTSTFPLIVTLPSLLQPSLSSGTTYWLEVLPADTNTFAGWEFDNENQAGVDLADVTPGAWTANSSVFTPSFQINV
jgi:hypothetical protein